MLALAFVLPLVGGVALAALAGSRRTASAYSEYLRSARVSDIAVNTPTPELVRVRAVARLPGVESSADYVGLNGYPIIDGRESHDFRLTGLFGSVDGRLFTQDRALVRTGRLPRLTATDEIALTPGLGRVLHLGVGDRISYRFRTNEGDRSTGENTFRVVGIASVAPVLVDDTDVLDGGILPPAATRRHLAAVVYSWQGLRLRQGQHRIDELIRDLATDPRTKAIPPIVQRVDRTTSKVQRAIRPQAVALAVFGGIVALATLVLGGQGIARVVARRSGDREVLSALGATRGRSQRRRPLTLASRCSAASPVRWPLLLSSHRWRRSVPSGASCRRPGCPPTRQPSWAAE